MTFQHHVPFSSPAHAKLGLSTFFTGASGGVEATSKDGRLVRGSDPATSSSNDFGPRAAISAVQQYSIMVPTSKVMVMAWLRQCAEVVVCTE